MKKAFIILAVLLMASAALNWWLATREPESRTVVERDTVWRDSVVRVPVATDSVKTGAKVYVFVPIDRTDTVRDTMWRDTVAVALEVEQKRYDDSMYTAWVSGYRPALDSIRLHLPQVTTVITTTVTEPAPRLSIGLQVGAGYGMFNRKPDVYVGVGGSFRF